MNLKKSIILILLVFTFHSYNLVAQDFHVSKSEVFEEPGTGWTKILQLRNGFTFMLHIDMNNYGAGLDGTDITIFDKDRKIVKSEKLVCKACTNEKMRPSFIRGFYEINGEPVLFIIGEDEEKTTFYRIRLNPNNGAVEQEDVIGTLDDDTRRRRFVFVYYHEVAGMTVVKDPTSDCYAVIILNWDPENKRQSIKAMHFDGTHAKLSEASYNPVNQKFKSLFFNSAVVDGNRRVFLFCKGRKNQVSKNPDSDYFLIMKLSASDKEFTLKPIDFTGEKEFNSLKSQMLYDKVSNRVRLFAVWADRTEMHRLSQTQITYYLAIVAGFDAENLTVSYLQPIAANKAASYAQVHISEDYEYTGIAKKMIHNKDNTVSILMEGGTTGHLGDLAVIQLSDTIELAGYVIAKRQKPSANINNSQFMSYDYVSTPKANYVILNDLAANFNKNENEEMDKMMVASTTSAIAYKLNNNELDGFFLFREPNKTTNTFAYIEGADYNDTLNTYATIIIERDGREKQARMAWVTFD